MTLAADRYDWRVPTRPTLREHIGVDPALRAALSVSRTGDHGRGMGFTLSSAGVILSIGLIITAQVIGSSALTYAALLLLAIVGTVGGSIIGYGAGRSQAASALAAGSNPRVREAIAADIEETYGVSVRPGSLPLLPYQSQTTGATTSTGIRIPVKVEFAGVDEPITLTRLPAIKG